jgi:hypothetical protein
MSIKRSAISSVDYILDIIREWIFFLVEFPVRSAYREISKKLATMEVTEEVTMEVKW